MSTRLVLLGAVLWAGAAPASTPAEPRPAVATLAGHEAVATKTRVDVAESPDRVS